MHHPLAILTIVIGVSFGWVWQRCHGAWQDWRGAIARMKNARRIFRREVGTTLLVIAVALLVVRGLAG